MPLCVGCACGSSDEWELLFCSEKMTAVLSFGVCCTVFCWLRGEQQGSCAAA
jgi:hypothetical protein